MHLARLYISGFRSIHEFDLKFRALSVLFKGL